MSSGTSPSAKIVRGLSRKRSNTSQWAVQIRQCKTLSCCSCLLLLFLPTIGCRAPQRRSNDGPPSFDRLLEIENDQPSGRSGSLSSRLRPGRRSGPEQRSGHALVQARRPGQAKSASEYGDEQQVSDEPDVDLAEALAGVPPQTRDLLKRQLNALQLRGESQSDVDAGNTGIEARNAEASSRNGEHYVLSDRQLSDNVVFDEQISSKELNEASSDSPPDTEDPETVVYSLSDDSDDSETAVTRAKVRHMASRQRIQDSSRAQETPRGETQDTQLASNDEVDDARQPRMNAKLAVETQDLDADQASSPVVAAVNYDERAETHAVQTASATRRESLDWQDHLWIAIRKLQEEQTNDSAATPAEQVRLAAIQRGLSTMVGDLDQAMLEIDGLQQREQDFFRHLFQAYYDAIDPDGNPVRSRRSKLVLQSLRKSLQNLAAISGLEVQNAAFCDAVESFGVVSEFPQYHFRAGQQVLLYCEVDNFVSEPIQDGYETQIQGSYDIIDSQGRRILEQALPAETDISSRVRRDYFIAYGIYLPESINPGSYKMRITMEDTKGRKFGQTTLEFRIID